MTHVMTAPGKKMPISTMCSRRSLAVLSFGVVGRDPSYSASVEELHGRVDDVPRSGAGTGAEGFVPDLLDADGPAPRE